MRTSLRTLFVLAGGLLLLGACSKSEDGDGARAGAKPGEGSSPRGTGKVSWIAFDDAAKKAATEGKHILIDFYTDWCGWCKKMDAETYTDGGVGAKLGSHFYAVKIDAESVSPVATIDGRKFTGKELAAAFRVEGFPATGFMSPEGKALTVLPGYQKPEQFVPVLEYIGGGHYRTKKFEEWMKTYKG